MRGLVGQYLFDPRMRVPQIIDGKAAEEIEIFLPIRVPYPDSVTVDENDLGSGVGGQYISVEESDILGVITMDFGF